MQQPLCHLYFLTVMEHLQSKQNSDGYPRQQNHLSVLVRSAASLQSNLETAEGGEAVLLWVELQAVIQVLIHQFVKYLDPAQPHRLGDYQLVADDLNR